MVRIQGMKRDVTPGLATALGGAGQAMAGAVGMRGELQRQDAQAQEMALQAEQAQMQRVVNMAAIVVATRVTSQDSSCR